MSMIIHYLSDFTQNIDNHTCTFRWLAIPYFQTELDKYVKVHNTTRQHANKHKVLPHGIPEHMFHFPKSVNALDLKVGPVDASIADYRLISKQVLIPDSLLDKAEEKWAPADDPIFDLVPPPFQNIADRCYDDLGRPSVTVKSFWTIYCALHDKVDATIPLAVITSLNRSILSEPGEGDLEAPGLGMGNAVGAGEVYVDEEDEEDVFSVSFTIDNDQDQLY